ncbi:MAG: transcriptional regulator, GntR family [Streptosporangiaceae bacterium]|nr:transcriptional regulator, GntR family [Streptosporangiaceae bacterium]
MPPVDPRSYRPKYIQVADQIRDRITAGEYQPGDRLPSERDLSDDYDVNPATARRALRTLQAEGLLTIERGVRAQVREMGERTVMRIQAGDRVVIRPATADEQRRLGLAAGAPVAVVTAADGGEQVVPAYDIELVVESDETPGLP